MQIKLCNKKINNKNNTLIFSLEIDKAQVIDKTGNINAEKNKRFNLTLFLRNEKFPFAKYVKSGLKLPLDCTEKDVNMEFLGELMKAIGAKKFKLENDDKNQIVWFGDFA